MNAVGIDIGTTGLKAVALGARGEILREKTVRYPTRLAGLGAEQDARAWWRAAVEALPEVVGGEPVCGVSVTCQAPTLVCVDGDFEPLGPALTWIDRRALREAEEISAAIEPTRTRPTRTSPPASSCGSRATVPPRSRTPAPSCAPTASWSPG